METKHTPGPWEYRLGMEPDGPDGAFTIYGPDTATLTARTRLQQTRNRRVTPKSAKHADEAAQ